MNESCKTCRFYLPKHKDGGYCRRLPPTLFGRVEGLGDEIDTHPNQNRPYVDSSDWCGEYAQKSTLDKCKDCSKEMVPLAHRDMPPWPDTPCLDWDGGLVCWECLQKRPSTTASTTVPINETDPSKQG